MEIQVTYSDWRVESVQCKQHLNKTNVVLQSEMPARSLAVQAELFILCHLSSLPADAYMCKMGKGGGRKKTTTKKMNQ